MTDQADVTQAIATERRTPARPVSVELHGTDIGRYRGQSSSVESSVEPLVTTGYPFTNIQLGMYFTIICSKLCPNLDRKTIRRQGGGWVIRNPYILFRTVNCVSHLQDDVGSLDVRDFIRCPYQDLACCSSCRLKVRIWTITSDPVVGSNSLSNHRRRELAFWILKEMLGRQSEVLQNSARNSHGHQGVMFCRPTSKHRYIVCTRLHTYHDPRTFDSLQIHME